MKSQDMYFILQRNDLSDQVPSFIILYPCLLYTSSCCPAWVKYAETFYPEILEHISTCKSPIGMQGIMVKEYFTKQMHLNKENVFTVAVTPCTAKKFEVRRKEIPGTDAVITVSELTKWLKAVSYTHLDVYKRQV